jgi:hypothetical protein
MTDKEWLIDGFKKLDKFLFLIENGFKKEEQHLAASMIHNAREEVEQLKIFSEDCNIERCNPAQDGDKQSPAEKEVTNEK